MSGFVHLHCHSTWSLLDGAIPAESLPDAAAALGYDAVALTDHDALTGAVRFASACRAAGVKPIYGAELTVGEQNEGDEDGATSRGTTQKRVGGRRDAPHPQSPSHLPTHVTVIARNATGYGNLCRLISDAHLGHERGEPRTTMARIADRAEG